MTPASMYEAPAFAGGGYPQTRYVNRRRNIPGYHDGGYPGHTHASASGTPTPGPTPTTVDPLTAAGGNPFNQPPPDVDDENDPDEPLFSNYDIGGGKIGVFNAYDELIDSFWPQESNGGAAGPDHFYEQMAEEARQFNEGLAFERDQEAALRKQRQYEASLAREQMMQDWRREQLMAQQRRRQLAVDAAGQSQNTFASMVPQMAPNQKLFFNPNALPGAATDNSLDNPNDRFAAPNIPALVY